MKSKYRIYSLLCFFLTVQHIQAIDPATYESYLNMWHLYCIRFSLGTCLEKDYESGISQGLSFEILGNQKFIAQKLAKELVRNKSFSNLKEHRNSFLMWLAELKGEDPMLAIKKNVMAISVENIQKLLPFIVSFQSIIEKNIKKSNKSTEVEWRKAAYVHFNSRTGLCTDVYSISACLELDLEKEFTLQELQSEDYKHCF
jgi:hypothetical protein